MFLSALLNDRTFATHTQETFDSVFPPKTDAFQALERVVSFENLDFVLAVVSISGMFGNPGQTSYAAYVLLSPSLIISNCSQSVLPLGRTPRSPA